MLITTGNSHSLFSLSKQRTYITTESMGLMFTFALINVTSVLKEAEANKLKLTPEFLELKFIDAIARNTKMFFGDKVFLYTLSFLNYYLSVSAVLKKYMSTVQVPNMVLDQRLLGNFLNHSTKDKSNDGNSERATDSDS